MQTWSTPPPPAPAAERSCARELLEDGRVRQASEQAALVAQNLRNEQPQIRGKQLVVPYKQQRPLARQVCQPRHPPPLPRGSKKGGAHQTAQSGQRRCRPLQRGGAGQSGGAQRDAARQRHARPAPALCGLCRRHRLGGGEGLREQRGIDTFIAQEGGEADGSLLEERVAAALHHMQHRRPPARDEEPLQPRALRRGRDEIVCGADHDERRRKGRWAVAARLHLRAALAQQLGGAEGEGGGREQLGQRAQLAHTLQQRSRRHLWVERRGGAGVGGGTGSSAAAGGGGGGGAGHLRGDDAERVAQERSQREGEERVELRRQLRQER